MANMRYILHRFLNKTVLVHVHEGGEETRIKAPVKLVVGDIKSLCIHMGQDNKCPCCELPYEWYDQRLYGAKQRTPESNMRRWQNHLDDVAKLVGTACEDFSFASSLTKVDSVEALEGKLAEAEAKMGVQEVRADLARRLESFEGNQLFGEEGCLEHYDGAAEGEQGYRRGKDSFCAVLEALSSRIAKLPRESGQYFCEAP
jgi:hypothetical protein